MSNEYFRLVEHWYPEDFPFDTEEETIELLNSVVPGTWEYLVSHDDLEPGIYLVEYVGELEDG